MLSSADFEHFQVLRVEKRLTRHLYLATAVCAEHGCSLGAMSVIDLRVLAERHPEYGPRGVIFEDLAALRRHLEPDDDAPTDETPAPSPAVH